MPLLQSIHKILLIDDDDDDCYVFRMLVGEIDETIEVVTAYEGDRVVALLDQHRPDLVFLDINLPKVNGHDCVRIIKGCSRHQQIPVVMYSSSAYSQDINLSYGLGATLYFTKSGNLSELRQSLQQILQMDWHEPGAITPHFYRNGKYYPFTATEE